MGMPEGATEFDAVVVGAGFAGLYQLYKLRELGLSVQVVEAADDVGGTWYWNRYPGARCDVASIEYSYSFDHDLEQDWTWTEVMAGQPEILTYANHVADRFDLRKHIQFGTRVVTATFDEDANRWAVETDAGDTYSAKYCIMATGCLSMPNTPDIPGQDDFAGAVAHTGQWPQEGVELAGKRVGIIGTGSSGVQAIPEIAKVADRLYVFQRTPVFTFPAGNAPLKPEFIEEVKSRYDEIRELERKSLVGITGWTGRAGTNALGSGGLSMDEMMKMPKLIDATAEERLEALRKYGFGIFGRYSDIRMDIEANTLAVELYNIKIHDLVDNEATARGLEPHGYPIGCKRQVIDTDYYAAFNRNNVTLVDLRETPIEKITAAGISTAEDDYELDVLIYATGFDAMTGAINAITFTGRNGETLRDKWQYGPRSYLGLQVTGFPNLFTITGPGSPSVLSNMMVSIEQHVEWITDCVAHMEEHGIATIEPEHEAEERWIEHVYDVAKNTIMTAESCNSWYLGANIPGKPRIFMPYIGGVGPYRAKCAEIAANGYEGFALA